jgi:hypothetical protein
MSPPSGSANSAHGSNFTQSNNGITLVLKIILIVFALIGCIRLVIIHFVREKRKTATSNQHAQETDKAEYQAPVERIPRQHAKPYSRVSIRQAQPHAESNDQPAPSSQPLYPWIMPHQPLPGPYDPQYYPLPTIRRLSDPEPSQDMPAKMSTVPYQRQIATSSPTCRSTLQGTITTSSEGWKRTQWVVDGG